MFEKPHPSGYDGIRSSLDAVVLRVREGRKHPMVRSWAGKRLVEAGNPKGHIERAKALFDAMKKQNIWVPDPRGVEYMAGAHVTLGDGTNPPEMPAGDCDDLCLAYLSACESVGIPTAVVGAAYDEAGNISHVLGMVTDGKGAWYYADPSTDFPFGEARKATHEEVIDVASGSRICVSASCSVPLRGQKMPDQGAGSFVAVDGLPDGMVGDETGYQQLTDDQKVQLARLSAQLGYSWGQCVDAYHMMRDVFSILGLPPPGDASHKVWTPGAEQVVRDAQSMVSIARTALDEAASGLRQVAIGQWESGPLAGVADVFVQRLPQDGYYVAIDDQARPRIYRTSDNQPISSPNAVSGWQYVVGIAAVAAISWAVAFALDSVIGNQTKQAEIAATDARNKREMDALAAGQLTPDQLKQLKDADARIAEFQAKKAAESPSPIKDVGKAASETLSATAEMFKGAAILAVVLGIGYAGFQVYQGSRRR